MEKNIRIAHVINPFHCLKEQPSYLFYAQPITFASMKEAKKQAKDNGLSVDLFSAHFQEDEDMVDGEFFRLPPLTRSVASTFEHDLAKPKKLPFLQDILTAVHDASNADYLVLTNVDISLQKDFYIAVRKLISGGIQAMSILRMDNVPKFLDSRRLGPEDLEILYDLGTRGAPHPGHDCFVFPLSWVPTLNMGFMFPGFPPWGTVLKNQLRKKAGEHFSIVRNGSTFHLGQDLAWNNFGNPTILEHVTLNRKLAASLL